MGQRPEGCCGSVALVKQAAVGKLAEERACSSGVVPWVVRRCPASCHEVRHLIDGRWCPSKTVWQLLAGSIRCPSITGSSAPDRPGGMGGKRRSASPGSSRDEGPYTSLSGKPQTGVDSKAGWWAVQAQMLIMTYSLNPAHLVLASHAAGPGGHHAA